MYADLPNAYRYDDAEGNQNCDDVCEVNYTIDYEDYGTYLYQVRKFESEHDGELHYQDYNWIKWTGADGTERAIRKSFF